MPSQKIKRVLISVYDKTGVVEFARTLATEFNIEIISTGGTARLLKENSIPVTLVDEVTGFPEMMDGRVKTLHPKIHAGILADRNNAEHMKQLEAQGIFPIDMVVVNLYPFQETINRPGCTFADAVEMIDIGGPCILRAAAKNHQHVFVVTDPQKYEQTLQVLRYSDDDVALKTAHREGGISAFWATCGYDAAVSAWLAGPNVGDDSNIDKARELRAIRLTGGQQLRYGENPHQQGRLFAQCDTGHEPFLGDAQTGDAAEVAISFNNYIDANAAYALCKELATSPIGQSGSGLYSACFIKHTNACGAGMSKDKAEAYRLAYLGDPNAAMGGILALDYDVDAAVAEVVMNTYAQWGKEAGASGFFVEVWLAPKFSEEAVEIIRSAKPWGKRARLLTVKTNHPASPEEIDLKKVSGGLLWQNRDLVGLNEDQWRVVTKREPTDKEMADLRLAWLICKHTKSNAITICKDRMLLGSGAGQMSRVMSCRIATWLARENGHAEKLGSSVAASDAFFPFRDGPDILMDAGVTALIQPGGSKRDEDTIEACNARGVAMVFTGTRHFKH